MKDCCAIPYSPSWEQVPPHSGEWVFQSTCPACAKVTECQPGGRDMQELHRLLAKHPTRSTPERTAQQEVSEVTLQESQDAALSIRIMADFKDWHRRADRTVQQIEAKLQECVGRCQAEMKHVPTRDKAVEGFGMMIARVQEFTVEDGE